MFRGTPKEKRTPAAQTAISGDIKITGDRLFLRPPTLGDWQQWADVRGANRPHLEPYEPEWPGNCLEKVFFQKRLARQARDWQGDRAYSFLIFEQNTGTLIGGVNVNNVTRGAAYSASLGYWLARNCQGEGYMTEALALLIDFAFTKLNLHRLNASCMPDNERSANLLLRLGFTEEGFAEKYLKIGGDWKDHRLFGLCAENRPKD